MNMPANTVGAPLGNTNARGKGKAPWREALQRALARDTRGRLDKAAEEVLNAASVGDLAAIKEIADRLDGRPAVAVQLELGDSFATRMLAAEERLRLMNAGGQAALEHVIEGELVEDDNDVPEFLR